MGKQLPITLTLKRDWKLRNVVILRSEKVISLKLLASTRKRLNVIQRVQPTAIILLLLLKVGDVIGAKNQVEKALEIDEKYVKAWAKKGDIEFLMKEYHKAMDSYKAGMAIEPNNAACKQGLQKVMMKVNSASSEEQAERQAHAMADPEIQQILQDPAVRQVLTDLQENPAYGQQAMQDPTIRGKIEKLIAAGVLQVK